MLFVGEVSFKLQGSKEGAFNFQPLLSIALTFLTDGEGILSPLKRRRKRRRSSAAVFIMRRFSIGTHQSSAVLIVLLSLFFNQSNSLAISGVSKRFLLTASSKPSYSDSAPQYISSLQRIFGFRMRRSTSQQSTPIGGGAYQEVTQRELLNGVSDNPVELKRPEKLKNKYYGLRHGESDANMAGIISSDPERGSKIHGLTVSGKVQARRAAGILIETVKRENLQNLVFLSSNFTRARETAEETLKAMINIIEFEEDPFRKYVKESYVADNTEATSRTAKTTVSTVISDIHLPDIMGNRINIIVDNRLRERYFGALDGLDLIYYNKVWPIDMVDSDNVRDGIESVGQVVKRVAALVDELESTYTGKSIVLTSHADTLQIMQTFLSFEDPRKFSQYRFKNGEVRDMEVLPDPVPMIYRGFFK